MTPEQRYRAIAWRGWLARLAVAEAVARGQCEFFDIGERAEDDAARIAGGGERGARLARLVYLVSFFVKKRGEKTPEAVG